MLSTFLAEYILFVVMVMYGVNFIIFIKFFFTLKEPI
jgi:hypothetical protein